MEERRVQESIDRLDQQLRGLFFDLLELKKISFFIQKFNHELVQIPVQDFKSKTKEKLQHLSFIFLFYSRNQKR